MQPSYPVTRIDSLMYEIGHHSASFQLWGFWDFATELDEVLLRRAVANLVIRAPVLGCMMARGFFRDRWIPIPDFDPKEQLKIHKVADRIAAEAASAEVVDSTVQVERGPGFAVHYFPYGTGSKLVLHLHHLFADGKGTVNLMAELAEQYRALGDDPEHVPCYPLDTRRSLWQVITRLKLKHWLLMGLSVVIEQIGKSFVGMSKLEGFHGDRPGGDTARVAAAANKVIELADDTLPRVTSWCQKREAKVNDFLMAAVLTALHRWNRRFEPPTAKYIPLVFAADMRCRYAPNAGPVANLTTAHRFWISQDLLGDFETTALAVKLRLDRMKRIGLGLDGIAMIIHGAWLPGALARRVFQPAFKLIGTSLRRVNALTNIGQIPAEAGLFGPKARADRCSILAPIFPAKNLLFAVTTYRGKITLQLGFDSTWLSRNGASSFGELIVEVCEEALTDSAPISIRDS